MSQPSRPPLSRDRSDPTVFLSYWSGDEAWATALHRNLVAQVGCRVFFAPADVRSGRAWSDELQTGLARAEQMVLVLSPESAVSARVRDEWIAMIAKHRDYRAAGRIQIAVHAAAPLPPFLASLQRIEAFRDPARYAEAFAALGRGLREDFELTERLREPGPGYARLPEELRDATGALLTPLLESRASRDWLADRLELPGSEIESLTPPEWPSAFLALAGLRAGDARRGAHDLLEALAEGFAGLEPQLAELGRQLEALAPEPPRPDLQTRYLRRVEERHQDLLPFFQDRLGNASLGQVYVELYVAPEDRAPRERKGASSPLGLDQLLALPPADFGLERHRWVVRGDPGCGKTTMLRHLAWSLACGGGAAWVPVFLWVRELVQLPGDPWHRIEAHLDEHGFGPELTEHLGALRKSGRLLLLLDGLDELDGERVAAARNLLGLLDESLGPSPLVVSSRSIGYQRPAAGFREADVLPLTAAQQAELLERCLSARGGATQGTSPRDWLAGLAGNPGLRAVCENPLLLTLLAFLIERGRTPEPLRSRLYDQVIDLLLESHQKEGEAGIDLKGEVRRALCGLAERMSRRGEISSPRDVLEADLLHGGEGTRTLLALPGWEKPRRVLDAIRLQTGILADYDGRDGPWRFWHRSFQEALTSEALERMEPAEREAFARGLEEHLNLWAEPFALLAGRSDEPDALVRRLVELNRPLGLRALATAERLADGTISEVLGLTEDVEERGQVILQIPSLLGDPDPEAGLDLLDRVRRSTTNGADLFFVDRALAQVAAEHPDLELRVRRLRGQLFAHLERPEGPLFERVRTCAGEVDLWATIPADSFQMGSPEREKGRWDDEGPRHAVDIHAPFCITVVPIMNAQYQVFDPRFEPYEWEGVSKEELERHPAVRITWYEAVTFSRWLGGRLPSEAEWEYACRAGSSKRFWSGGAERDLQRVGWFDKNSDRRTHAVGEKPANPFGLHDVHGNVWEWCQDAWSEDYLESGSVHPKAHEPGDADTGAVRVTRGGSYWYESWGCRSAFRSRWVPDDRSQVLGFRVAGSVPPSS